MAKPKLALIPATQGSKLYSVLPADGVGDFNFSRNTAATRINKDGLIETVAVGKSRLNYPLIDGVVNGCPSHLLEPQRTNGITYSNDFSNAIWLKVNSSIGSNVVISPDGTLNADKIIPSSGVSVETSFAYQKFTKPTTSKTYIVSVFAKIGEYNQMTLYTRDDNTSSNRAEVKFSLLNGSIISSASSFGTFSNASSENGENVGNGWYRFKLKLTTGTENRIQHRVVVSNSTALNGDGASGIYVFGASIEEGSFISSYIPTTNSATTRSAETANGAGDASTFNDSEGVLMVEASALANDGTYRNICLSDGSLTNRILIQYTPTANQINIVIIYSGGQYSLSHTVSNVKDFSKFLIKYKVNDLALWVNGFEVDTDTSGVLPIGLNTLSFDNTIGDAFYSNTKQIQYFDSALNDSDLETLTSWTSFTDLANGQLYSIK